MNNPEDQRRLREKNQGIRPGISVLIFAGIAAGFLRGAAEAYRLYYSYPIHGSVHHLWELIAQCGFAYAVVVAGGGLLVFFTCRLLVPDFRKNVHWILICFLLVMAVIDLAGMNASSSPDYFKKDMDIKWDLNGNDLLIITIDTCRAGNLGMYGDFTANTPFLNRFSLQGTVFCDAVTSIPVTTPAHVSLFTGLDPPLHGSRFNAVPVDDEIPLLASVLDEKGYNTGAFVSAFPVTGEVSGLNHGFDYFDQMMTPKKWQPLLYRSNLVKPFLDLGPFRPAERSGWETVQSAVSWWRKLPDYPRFTWVHLYDPHAPYSPGETFRKMFSNSPVPIDTSIYKIVAMNTGKQNINEAEVQEFINAYNGEIAAVDRQIEMLFRELARTNRLDKTTIVVTADHGESLDEHKSYFSHGSDLFDVSLKIPLIMMSPVKVPAGRVIQDGVSIIDVFPSVLSLLGFPGNQIDCNGIDLSQIFDNKSIQDRWLFHETGAGVYIAAHEPRDDRVREKQRAVRNLGEKLVFMPDGQHIYFDLQMDPAEKNGISGNLPKGGKGLSDVLVSYINQVDPAERRPAKLPQESSLQQLRALGYLDSP